MKALIGCNARGIDRKGISNHMPLFIGIKTPHNQAAKYAYGAVSVPCSRDRVKIEIGRVKLPRRNGMRDSIKRGLLHVFGGGADKSDQQYAYGSTDGKQATANQMHRFHSPYSSV